MITTLLRTTRLAGLAAAGALTLAACSGPATTQETRGAAPASTASASASPSAAAPEYGTADSFTVTSADLAEDGTFDETVIGSALAWCDGPGESLAVEWTAPPEGTQSFALVMENNTREFVYWLQYDIDPTEVGTPHGLAQELSGIDGRNSVGFQYPVAPCPEVGETHTIEVTVYALDRQLGERGLRIDEFEAAIEGGILAQASVTGTLAGPPA